jgi:TetR/AcrR family transcriptional regulator, ethionamide resistance regulator
MVSRETHAKLRVKRQERRRLHLAKLDETDIVEVAERMLQHCPFRAITVEALMGQVGLARSAFYKHFHDLHDVLIRLLSKYVEEQDKLNGQLLERNLAMVREGHDGFWERRDILRDSLLGVFELRRKNYNLLQAMTEESVTVPKVNAMRERILENDMHFSLTFYDKFPPTGPARDLDLQEMARALILLNESYMLDALARDPQADATRVTEILATTFLCAAYGGLLPAILHSSEVPSPLVNSSERNAKSSV